MGVTKRVFRVCEHYFQDSTKKIAELGAQYVMEEEWGTYGPPYFKDVFSHLDITSFDITGEHNTVVLDLSKPLEEQYPEHKNKYDIVTNFGTTEHVQNQHECWKTIFKMLKKDGIVISEIPKKKNWPWHCKYYYDEKTFRSMKKDFDLLETKDIYYEGPHFGNNIYAVMRKIHDSEFLTTSKELHKRMEIRKKFIDPQGR